MKKRTIWNAVILIILSIPFFTISNAQSPGLITTPKNGNGVTILNPNGDAFTSATSAGFTTNDITQSEILYRVVPPAISESQNDPVQGPSGGFTDIVSAVDGSGFYAYFDGTNILFRLRLGGTNNGSKAYSILIDTDLKFGNSGPYTDPNYIGSTNNGNGNPGFEYEVVFGTHTNVSVYDVDGRTAGVLVASYPLNTNSQISVALSRVSNDPDYFYDWGVPVSTIGSPAYIRMVASAQVDPKPALQGKSSDMYGLDDGTISSVPAKWTKIIDAQCGFGLPDISITGSGICATCTSAPIVTNISGVGVNKIVSGTWTSLDPSKPNTATISLFRNGTLVGTTVATTGLGWSITVAMIYSNDFFYAKAKATNESECLQSSPVISGCASPPAAPIVTCAKSKGIDGTIPLGASVFIFEVTGTNANPTNTLLTAGLEYVDNATDRTFNFHGNASQTGTNACVPGAPDVNDGTYMLVTNLNGCLSPAMYICISGNSFSSISTTVASNGITLTTPVLSNQTSVSGSGATTGELLRLFINGVYVSSVTATATTFTINNVNLEVGDVLRVYAQATAAGSCLTISNSYTVTCFTQPPSINTNAAGNIISTATSITGKAPDKGATINLYRGTPMTGTLVGSTTVTNIGDWTIGGLTLTAGESYYATETVDCESAASAVTVVMAPTLVCPTITGTYTELSTVVDGTMPSAFTGKIRLYLDGAELDSTNITNATTWSIPVNTVYTNRIYADGLLTATAEGLGLAENQSCSTTVLAVLCTSPVAPVVTPTSATISRGQNVTFTVSNAVDSLLYSITDVNGANYATSKFGTASPSLTIPSIVFNAVGTYNLFIVCDKLFGISCTNYYDLTITVNPSTLPVRFINVAASKSGNQTKVSWDVVDETDVKYYQVERSLDCINYEIVAKVNYTPSNQGNNSYTVYDNLVHGNKVCYRIIQVDKTDRYQYSNVVSIFNIIKIAAQIIPNPAKTQANLYVNSLMEQIATIELLDLNGKSADLRRIRMHQGSNVVSMDGLNKYPIGNYIIRLVMKSEVQYLRLIIQ